MHSRALLPLSIVLLYNIFNAHLEKNESTVLERLQRCLQYARLTDKYHLIKNKNKNKPKPKPCVCFRNNFTVFQATGVPVGVWN